MSSHETTAQETSVLGYEPSDEQDEWLEESEQLPRRPRRRLLAPVPLALLAVLLIACGFLAGVEVQKGQTGSSSGALAAGGTAGGGIASRLAALRGGAPGATGAAGAGGTGFPGGSGSKGAANAFPGAGGSGAGGVTTGEVSFVRGNTLYVTNSQGNTVKVSAAAGSKVTKTVSTKATSIHPGDTVLVLGSKAKSGAISASSISVSSSSSGSTGAGAGSSDAGRGSSSAGASGGGTTALFGPG